MLFRTTRCCLVLLLALLLGACAGMPLQGDPPGAPEAVSLAHARKALADATLCCTRFSQFDFKHALPSSLTPFTIGPGRPVADFNGSRSWFLAFHLPKHAHVPYDVLFKSNVTGRWLHHSYLFAPTVVLLDAAFRPLRVQDIQLCEYMGWTRSRSGAFGRLHVKNPAARYLVVYSSGDQLADSTYWEQSPTAFSAASPVQMASSGSFQIPHGPNGLLSVGKLTDAYRSAVDDAICGRPDPSAGTGIFSTTHGPSHATRKLVAQSE